MREMKNSIVPGIESIPSAWEVVPLKSKFSFGKGLSITKSDLVESGIPVLSYGQIHSKKNKRTTIDDSLLRFVPKWKTLSSPDSRAIQNGFIFADTSEDRDGCGNCNYVDKDGLYAGYHTIVLKPKTNENWKYLGYLFQTDAWRYQFRRDLTEVKLYSVSQKILKNSYILVPPKEERAAIVDFLDKKCAEIDSLTADVQKEIETLQEYRRSLITEAVTKGLDPDVEMKDSGITWLGFVPKQWKVKAAKYCVDIRNGSDPKTEGDIPVYGSGAESFRTCGEFKEGPVVLIGRKGATLHIPHYIEGKYWNVDTAFDVRTKQGYLLRFYYYVAMSFDYKYYISQTTLPSMTQTDYGNMRIPCPDTEEQDAIVMFLDTKCDEIDSILKTKQEQLETLAEYRKSLIYEYVTGKKEVI